jgi:hypothetical protein
MRIEILRFREGGLTLKLNSRIRRARKENTMLRRALFAGLTMI